jgi:UDP-glucuronate 4-epimerase
MVKYLITGAAGFIGSHLVKRLLESGHEVIAVDALIDSTYGAIVKRDRFRALENLKSDGLTLIQKDLRFDSLSAEIEECDAVINLAAMPGLPLSWEEFDLYLSCNVVAVERLIQSFREVGPRRLIHISTSSVYGRYAVGDESQTLNPCSPYGVTKASAEMLIRGYQSIFDLNATILRYFSVYGPGQRPDMAYSKFIRAISEGEPIYVHGDGHQLRSNTYITDCVDATISAIANGRAGEAYNIAGSEDRSVLESISIIESHLNKKADLRFTSSVAGDQQNTKGITLKASSDLNFQPRVSLEEGLSRQINAYFKRSFFEV